jgi:alpha/beta superfamily hydrolase
MVERRENQSVLVLESVVHEGSHEGVEHLVLQTNAGPMVGRYHPAEESKRAVIWVGGAGGGLYGPAGGLYPRLAEQLTEHRIASLRLDYRCPNDLQQCVVDTLLAGQYLLQERRHDRVALVGHSFGGAVVICAGVVGEGIGAVAALSSQTYGTRLVEDLKCPLLLIHGTDDEILPDTCSRNIFLRANQPKQLLLYENCRHGLDECRDQLDQDLRQWLLKQLPER